MHRGSIVTQAGQYASFIGSTIGKSVSPLMAPMLLWQRMPIVGTGVDLCEVDRIKKAITSSHGARLLERVFTPREIAYAQRKANPYERYAARFAAKEAGMKALGTGWRGGPGWPDLEVINLPSGRPTLQMHRRAAELTAKPGAGNIALSLTRTS